jgi:hypothetical protein
MGRALIKELDQRQDLFRSRVHTMVYPIVDSLRRNFDSPGRFSLASTIG